MTSFNIIKNYQVLVGQGLDFDNPKYHNVVNKFCNITAKFQVGQLNKELKEKDCNKKSLVKSSYNSFMMALGEIKKTNPGVVNKMSNAFLTQLRKKSNIYNLLTYDMIKKLKEYGIKETVN